jgi:hypothetical protein
MPSYAHLDATRLTFYGTDGMLYELRSLPLAKRDLFINEWGKFRSAAVEVEDLGDFCDRYDRLKPDGTPNPNHDADFRRLTNWLLAYIVAHEPISGGKVSLLDVIDASTVVGLLLSKDGGPSVLEQIEFPPPKEKAPKGEPLPDGVDPTGHALASLATYTDGDLSKALELASDEPYQELREVMAESYRLSQEAQGKTKGKPTASSSTDDPLSAFLDMQQGKEPEQDKVQEPDLDLKRKAAAKLAGDMGPVIHAMQQLATKPKP